VFVNDVVVDPSDWYIRAQVRKNSATVDAVFEWTSDGTDILIGSAEVKKADGGVATTGTVQLRLRPSAWVGKPANWSGYLDIELSSDSSDDPDLRYTIVRKRPFQIVADVEHD
jgi:hypothetical protein